MSNNSLDDREEVAASGRADLSGHSDLNAPASSLFGRPTSTSQSTVDLHDTPETNELPAVSRSSTKSFHTAPSEATPDTKRRSTNIGALYDEIEPEYKRLTLGDLDFDKLNFKELSSDWQQLKGQDTPAAHASTIPETAKAVPDGPHDPEESQLLETKADRAKQVSDSHQARVKHAEEDELVQPEVLVTTARKPRVIRDESAEDDRPDAAKIEDLKRFAYAHGSARAASERSKPRGKQVDEVRAELAVKAQEEAKLVNNDAEIKVPVAPGETLSFSRKSKVSKILGLKMDSSHNDNAHQKQTSQASNSDFSDEEDETSPVNGNTATPRESPFTSTAPTRSNTATRSRSFKRMETSSDSLVLSDQTAKRALLIKAAHLEVCNLLTRNSRNVEAQADGSHAMFLSGLSFWGRLTDQEKLKSQPTIIEIMHRYSHESHFSENSLDQVITRGGGNSGLVHDGAVTLDPKSDLPLSTDIDNEVGRSKAAAEYIIERLSEKLGSTTFHDDGDNVFKVPIKGKSPLARIEGDKEWRLVQEAVSAHALGRGYQVQMGDGPEDITKPWQVRQKGELKDALTSFTKWPSASELVWVKVNRLGVDN